MIVTLAGLDLKCYGAVMAVSKVYCKVLPLIFCLPMPATAAIMKTDETVT